MSQENVEIVRRLEVAHNVGDIDAMLADAHSDVELELVGGFADLVGQRIFSGGEEVRRFFTDWFATFKTVSAENEKLLEVDEGIVAFTNLKATVEGSETPVELQTAAVYTFRDGKIIRVASYYDRREALETLGLSE